MQKYIKSPYVWVALWLIFLGSAIWLHAKRASQPPLYDAFSYYSKAQDPTKPSFDVKVPVNWVSPAAHNLQDLLKSRYVVFIPVSNPQEIRGELAQPSVDNFWQEYALFHSWFSTLNENDGVHEVSQTSSRLIEITDPQKLKTSLATLIKSHSWRPLFNTINSGLENSPTTLER